MLTTELKNWVLVPRAEGDDEIRLTQSQAEYISKAWRTSPNAELRDSSTGNLLEIVNRNDYRLRRSGETRNPNGGYWICSKGGRHPLGQGVIANSFGRKEWHEICDCR